MISTPTNNIQQGEDAREQQDVSVGRRAECRGRRAPQTASRQLRSPAAIVRRRHARDAMGSRPATRRAHESRSRAPPSWQEQREARGRNAAGGQPSGSATVGRHLACRATCAPTCAWHVRAGSSACIGVRSAQCAGNTRSGALCAAQRVAVAGGAAGFRDGFRPFLLRPRYRATNNGPAQVCTFI
jgi:hypothetical protein